MYPLPYIHHQHHVHDVDRVYSQIECLVMLLYNVG